MIKKLRHRFIFITMASISFIFILILMTINMSMTLSSRRQGYSILWDYASRPAPTADFIPPDKPSADTEITRPSFRRDYDWFNNMRIFSVVIDENGGITNAVSGKNPNLTDEMIKDLAARVLNENKLKNDVDSDYLQGIVSGYLYLYKPLSEGAHLYFLDYAPEKDMSGRLFRLCLWIGLAGMLVIFIVVIFLSRWVTQPVRLAFDRQKQFVADASHELKTPLTIITTNAEVLESSTPDNKWLANILEQSSRMKTLINNLLDLTKLDSYEQSMDLTAIDLSRSVKSTALSFESLAFEYGKHYEMQIEDGLTVTGNDSSLRQLVTILLDNAFHYSDVNGTIRIRLIRHGDKKELTVWNSGCGIKSADQKRIFERFYRSDASRSRESGGYGLGLSIAQSVVDMHRGHIQVKSDGQSYTLFLVTLP